MNPSGDQLLLAAKLLDEHFQLESSESFVISSDYKMLKERLTILIRHCLLNDFNRLLNALYRIDVREEDFKKAMDGNDLNVIADEIASLVIKRELEKVMLRIKYKQGDN